MRSNWDSLRKGVTVKSKWVRAKEGLLLSIIYMQFNKLVGANPFIVIVESLIFVLA